MGQRVLRRAVPIRDLPQLRTSPHSTEQIPYVVIIAVWIRAGLDIEGNLPVSKNKDGELNPELSAYPILLKAMQGWIPVINKKGLQSAAFCFSIWVHTLRSIIRPELSDLANRMWDHRYGLKESTAGFDDLTS